VQYKKNKKQMEIKSIVSTPVANPIGAIGGGLIGYFLAKKGLKLENKWAVIGVSVAGVVLGAMAQAKYKSKATLATTVAKKA
jgi:hypothetical protein